MNLKSRKIISLALVFFMMLTILPMAPVTAFAAEPGGANLSQLIVGDLTITGVDEKLGFIETRGFIYDGTLSHPTLYLYNYTGGAIKFYQDDNSNKNISIDVIVSGNCPINGVYTQCPWFESKYPHHRNQKGL